MADDRAQRAGGAVPTREWSIGELAVAAGVTVRTLHHYDRLGLVRASRRTAAGHRRYAADDVHRLYRVLALRQLGLPLDRISDALAADAATLPDVARQQLAHVDSQLRDLARLRDRLARLADADRAIPGTNDPSDSFDHLMEAINVTVHLTRIYTRSGDDGSTALGDRTRVPKTSPHVEALGTIDELNAQIGAALATGGIADTHRDWLRRVQNDLFDAGADLSVPPAGPAAATASRLDDTYTRRLEAHCDDVNDTLTPLRSFVLPGGSAGSAQLHLCRTVCRRAERRVLGVDNVNPAIARYLNRLSDLLFILARAAASDEPLWEPAAGAAAG